MFLLGAFIGFPLLIIGLAVLFFTNFRPEIFERVKSIIFKASNIHKNVHVFPVTAHALNWLARHEHSPSRA